MRQMHQNEIPVPNMKFAAVLISAVVAIKVDQQWKTAASKNMAAAGLPDPHCATAVSAPITRLTRQSVGTIPSMHVATHQFTTWHAVVVRQQLYA